MLLLRREKNFTLYIYSVHLFLHEFIATNTTKRTKPPMRKFLPVSYKLLVWFYVYTLSICYWGCLLYAKKCYSYGLCPRCGHMEYYWIVCRRITEYGTRHALCCMGKNPSCKWSTLVTSSIDAILPPVLWHLNVYNLNVGNNNTTLIQDPRIQGSIPDLRTI